MYRTVRNLPSQEEFNKWDIAYRERTGYGTEGSLVTNKDRELAILAAFPGSYAEDVSTTMDTVRKVAPSLIIGTTALVTGLGLAGVIGEPVVSSVPVLNAPSALAPATAEISFESLASYDAAVAAGAAEGVGTVTGGSAVATGAESGVLSTVGSGLKTFGGWIGSGLTSIFKGATSGVQKGVNSIIDREVSSMFGGSGNPGMSTTVTPGSGVSMLPIILIGVTLLGAFILMRKRRKS